MPELRDLPGIDRLTKDEALAAVISAHGLETVKAALRQLQQSWRACGTAPDWAVDAAGYAHELSLRMGHLDYQPVFNLTGTIIHTNLGRSMLSESLYDAVRPLVTQPMNLEFNLETGKRGDRDAVVERRLCVLTGAEAATVVNNNAAALMLVLNTFAQGRRVPVSRGELIEIGGSFRLPELMTRAGCELLEVGTTNRTHLKDFQARRAWFDPELVEKQVAGQRGRYKMVRSSLWYPFCREMPEDDVAVPDEFVDQGALIGPKERIRARFRAWEDSGITGLTIGGDEEALRVMADVARLNVEPG